MTNKRKRRRREEVSAAEPKTRWRDALIWPTALLASAALLAASFWLTREPSRAPLAASRRNTSGAARRLLQECLARYRQLHSYRDQTSLRLRYPAGGQWVEETTEMLLHFERPNKLRIEVRQPTHRVLLAVDGDQIRARIDDPQTSDFDNQFVQRKAPARLELSELYASTEYVDLERPQEMQSLLMAMPAPFTVSQLAFLMEADPLTPLLERATEVSQLADETTQGRSCHRIQLVTGDGKFTFWLDSQQKLLRRIEYPLPAANAEVDAGRRPQLVSDYVNVAADVSIDPAKLQLQPPAGARLVRHFVLPPADAAAGKLGQTVPSFSWTGLNGDLQGSDPGNGTVSVWLWFDHQAPSRTALSELQRVCAQFRDTQRLRVVAVCVEPSTKMSHADVRRLIDQWSVTLPVRRDLDAVGRDLFGISQVPAVVIVDAEGKLQVVEAGATRDLEAQLPQVLEQLLAGKDLATAYLEFLTAQQRAYRQHLAAASVELPEVNVELAAAEVAQESTPRQMQLQLLWRNRQLRQPGNLLVTNDESSGTRIIAVEGWNQVAELAVDGAIERRHALTEPDTLAVSELRTAVDASGKRWFLGLSALAAQVAVYDADWQLVGNYPPAGQPHPGIQDATLADLDQDGRLELYVGFAGVLGVHRVQLNGETTWRNRRVSNVISLTAAADRTGRTYLLVTSASGEIIPVDSGGKLQQPLKAGTQAVHQLVASDPQQADSVFCGASILTAGNLLVAGLDGRFAETWKFQLPTGGYANQIRRITAMMWGDPPQQFWLLVGPDSSLHVISRDASFHDHFNVGVQLAGATAARVGDRNLLVLATADEVTAWSVTWGPLGRESGTVPEISAGRDR